MRLHEKRWRKEEGDQTTRGAGAEGNVVAPVTKPGASRTWAAVGPSLSHPARWARCRATPPPSISSLARPTNSPPASAQPPPRPPPPSTRHPPHSPAPATHPISRRRVTFFFHGTRSGALCRCGVCGPPPLDGVRVFLAVHQHAQAMPKPDAIPYRLRSGAIFDPRHPLRPIAAAKQHRGPEDIQHAV